MPVLETARESRIQWGESVRFALNALAVDKIKASLTMLGVVIGSAALVLVVMIASTGKVYIVSQIEAIGANIAYATLDRHEGYSAVDDELTPADMAALVQRVPTVRTVAGTYDSPVEFRLRHRTLRARLVGVTQDFGTIRNLRITSGRYFDAQDFAGHFKVCLITDEIARKSFAGERAVGTAITVDQFRCVIIGTFREGISTFGQSEIQENTLLVPFPLVKDITGDNFFQVLYAQASASDEVPGMTQAMNQLLHSRHRRDARYNVQNLSSLLETADSIALAMTIVLIAIATLTLVTAGTGIMNIMLVNVTQRTQEIGVRKALGARPSEIRFQFLLEAFFISFGGAIVGVLAAIAIIWPASRYVESGVPLGVSWPAVIVALIVSSAVGILFGYRPASEAAALNPIDAMRLD